MCMPLSRGADPVGSVGHVGGVAALKQGEVRSYSSQLTHLGLPAWVQGTELCVPLGISLAPLMLTLACL